jgi:non-homologous end joining protein Ku
LIDRLTTEEFKPENYKDEYRIRVLGMLDEKSKGREIVIDKAPAPKHGQVIDLMCFSTTAEATSPKSRLGD